MFMFKRMRETVLSTDMVRSCAILASATAMALASVPACAFGLQHERFAPDQDGLCREAIKQPLAPSLGCFDSRMAAGNASPSYDELRFLLQHLRPNRLSAETVLPLSYVDFFGEKAFFTVRELPDDIFARMEGVTFPETCPVAREDLKYVRLLHVDVNGNIKVGEMVAHQSIADDLREIFLELYHEGYPIERMRLPDDYDGNDEKSMEDNNTSCFNCRPIEGTDTPSLHSYGLAVDVNTLYNVYVQDWSGVVLPTTGLAYADRSIQTPYTIVEGDLCHRLFAEHGFSWGGDWAGVHDYQHFEKDMR